MRNTCNRNTLVYFWMTEHLILFILAAQLSKTSLQNILVSEAWWDCLQQKIKCCGNISSQLGRHTEVGGRKRVRRGRRYFWVDCPCTYVVCHLLISILAYHFQCSLTSHALVDKFFFWELLSQCVWQNLQVWVSWVSCLNELASLHSCCSFPFNFKGQDLAGIDSLL